MEYSEIIYLISEVLEEDEIGNTITSSSTSNKCYAKKQSVRTNEFYNASMVGLTPSCEFIIKRLNYNGESELEWNNDRYEIIRTIDPKNKFDIVLVCSKKIGVN
jgi:SPP1 family predicted phage head-tail adaptor